MTNIAAGAAGAAGAAVRRRAAVLGSPIGHSLSPVLHRAAYDALGLDWDYTAVECDEAGLARVFQRVRAEPGWVGLSLTMPLKRVALDLLDDVDPLASAVGAVNTVVVGSGGDAGSGGNAVSGGDAGAVRLGGFNTDVAGIAYAVRQVLAAPHPPRRPLVLGAGGTARAALAALASAGAGRAGVVALHPQAARPLVKVGASAGVEVSILPWDTLAAGVPPEVDLVVSTTPAGATDDLATRRWPAGAALVELLYHPWPTRLAARAHTCGARVVSGLTILAAQAVGQVELFAGTRVDVGLLLSAGQAALDARFAVHAGRQQ